MWIELGVPAQNWIHLPLYSLKWKTWHFDIFLTDLLIKKDHCYHMLDPETKMPKSQQLLPLVYGQPMKRMVKWPSTMMNLRWSLWTVRFVYSTVLPVPHFKIHTVFIHQESTTCIFKGFYKVYSLFPHKKMSEERMEKCHTDDLSLPRSGGCLWLKLSLPHDQSEAPPKSG